MLPTFQNHLTPSKQLRRLATPFSVASMAVSSNPSKSGSSQEKSTFRPTLVPASISNGMIKIWNGRYKALVDGTSTDCVHGSAWKSLPGNGTIFHSSTTRWRDMRLQGAVSRWRDKQSKDSFLDLSYLCNSVFVEEESPQFDGVPLC